MLGERGMGGGKVRLALNVYKLNSQYQILVYQKSFNQTFKTEFSAQNNLYESDNFTLGHTFFLSLSSLWFSLSLSLSLCLS